MRIATPIGLAAAAVLVGVSLAPAASTVVRPHSQIAPLHRAAISNFTAMRPYVKIPHAFIPMKKGSGSVYVADSGVDAVYGYASTGGSPTYTVSGLSEPQGMASDKKDIFVANTGTSQVFEYAPPSTTPALSISDPGEYPVGVAVNKKGTAIWVTNIISTSDTAGNLLEYNGSGTLVQTITCSNLEKYYFVAVDGDGNVAVDGSNLSDGSPAVDYIPAGSTTCNTTTIPIEFPGGLMFDKKGNLGVDDQDADTITTYAPPTYSTKVASASLSGISDPVTFAFNKGSKDAWTANAGSASATEFKFPAGGSAITTITTDLAEPIGIAVQPPNKAGK
jgi:hypothetical protein